MRKAIAVVIMIVVCSIYFIAMRSTDEEIKSAKGHESISDTTKISDINKMIEEIEEEYPGTPKMIIEINNRIMQYQYSEKVDENLIVETLKALRMLYSDELLKLNSYERQLENLKVELDRNQLKELYLTDSKINSIEFPAPDYALVEVIHHTTNENQVRQYTLVKESDLWKIYKWKDLSLTQDETTLEE